MSEWQLNKIIDLLERLVDQTRPQKQPEYKVEVHAANLSDESIAKIAHKTIAERARLQKTPSSKSEEALAHNGYDETTKIANTWGKKRPIIGAEYIPAIDVVPDVDAISVDGGKTYNLVLDAQYLDGGMVELTTDAGYKITTNNYFKHRFRANPEHYAY